MSNRNIFGISGLAGIALVLILIFGGRPLGAAIQTTGSQIFQLLLTTWSITTDVLWILLLILVISALLIPLQAMGWWAGWYGDEIDTRMNPGELQEDIKVDDSIRKFVVYLDGISQSQHRYIPEVERFLDELAAILPDDIVIIRGLMPYSILNEPLTENGLLSFFWRIADYFQMTSSGGILGALIGATINVRNILIVSVSADQRYGPIYNQGTAQIIFNSLKHHGYRIGSQVPITLLGYSGGAQMALGAAPALKRSLQAPIEVISLSGVMSGNHNILELEHLYHIVGEKDLFEKEGPIMFPRRWKIMALSHWNRAKRRGKISFISLGPVGHNAGGGPYSTKAYLPDGRSYLQQTVEIISNIIQDNSPLVRPAMSKKLSNYDLYQKADFTHPDYYPLKQAVDSEWYRAIAPWTGRLILPKKEERQQVRGVFFEVHNAPAEHQALIGTVVILRWSQQQPTQAFLRAVRKDVHFSSEADYSQKKGTVHPERLDHWQRVGPLESLAGSRPNDDVIVTLHEPELLPETAMNNTPILCIDRPPIQITGRYYALVQIVAPVDRTAPTEHFRVVHFNRVSGQFDGKEEVVYFPRVMMAKAYKSFPSTTRDIEKSVLNETGWYIYGAKNAENEFVVQAIAPRALLRLQPDQFIVGKDAAWKYIKTAAWKVKGQKGTVKSVLLAPRSAEEHIKTWGIEPDPAQTPPIFDNQEPIEHLQVIDPNTQVLPTLAASPVQTAIAQWREGDRALVLHTYGGIGGKRKEPAAKTPIFFGHFAYGVATVVREPLANELIFDITYYQVYTHNVDGITAGKLAWNRFMGDRQYGWLGSRPVCDILIKHPSFTDNFEVYGEPYCVLDVLLKQLETMMARYRIGDGTGGTYVGIAHNCAQDSNQAMYAALKRVLDAIQSDPDFVKEMQDDPGEAVRFRQLVTLTHQIRQKLLPFGSARADWKKGKENLGISPEEDFFQGVMTGLRSWRTLFPRVASEAIAKQFIYEDALVWVLRTNQVGGYDPDIEPIAPTQLGY